MSLCTLPDNHPEYTWCIDWDAMRGDGVAIHGPVPNPLVSVSHHHEHCDWINKRGPCLCNSIPAVVKIAYEGPGRDLPFEDAVRDGQ